MPSALITFPAQPFSVAHGNAKTVVRGENEQMLASFGGAGLVVHQKDARREAWTTVDVSEGIPTVNDGGWQEHAFDPFAPIRATTPKVFAATVPTEVQLWVNVQHATISFYFGWGSVAQGYDERAKTSGLIRWSTRCTNVTTTIGKKDENI